MHRGHSTSLWLRLILRVVYASIECLRFRVGIGNCSLCQECLRGWVPKLGLVLLFGDCVSIRCCGVVNRRASFCSLCVGRASILCPFSFKRWYNFESCMVIEYWLGFCMYNPTHLMQVFMVLWSRVGCSISLYLILVARQANYGGNYVKNSLCFLWRVASIFARLFWSVFWKGDF